MHKYRESCVVLSFCLICGCENSGGESPFLQPEREVGDLRVVSWNMKAARASSLSRVAERLALLDADVVALQEVDQNTVRTGGADQPGILGESLGYESVFDKAVDLEGGGYGIAILSRFPISDVQALPLSNEGAAENRVALEITTCRDGKCLHVVNHHADRAAGAAQTSVSEILAAIAPSIGDGILFLGDLNQRRSGSGPRACVADGLDDLVADFGEAPSLGNERVDYVFADVPMAACARRAGVVATPESDHNAVLADFDFSSCGR